MKKTYLNPELQVIKVQTQQMIATSVAFGDGQKDGSYATGRDYDFEDED